MEEVEEMFDGEEIQEQKEENITKAGWYVEHIVLILAVTANELITFARRVRGMNSMILSCNVLNFHNFIAEL